MRNVRSVVSHAILLLSMLVSSNVFAQQAVTVTDSMPAMFNGLQMGFQILKQSEKEVGDKGNFSRYSLRFYVTNTTNEAKIIMYKQGFNPLGGSSPEVARFNCLNATGARLTSKTASLQAPPCNVLADVEDKDCATNKTSHAQRFVQIGYWIKAGQTIHTDAIMIVPLNEKPNVTAMDMFHANSLVGNSEVPLIDPSQQNADAFVKLKSAANNTYINNETSQLASTKITEGWWSAQWQLVPVAGSQAYMIKNRWRGNFIAVEQRGAATLANYQSAACMWLIVPVPNSTAVRFKNAMDGSYLGIVSGSLVTMPMRVDDVSGRWFIEPQE